MSKYTDAINTLAARHNAALEEVATALAALKKAEAFRRRHKPSSYVGKDLLESAKRTHSAAVAAELVAREKLRKAYMLRGAYLDAQARKEEEARRPKVVRPRTTSELRRWREERAKQVAEGDFGIFEEVLNNDPLP